MFRDDATLLRARWESVRMMQSSRCWRVIQSGRWWGMIQFGRCWRSDTVWSLLEKGYNLVVGGEVI